MKIFFDTEFTGLHKNTTLISIGLVDENENSIYAEMTDYDSSQVDEWLETNVIQNLYNKKTLGATNYAEKDNKKTYINGNKEFVRKYILEWLNQYKNIEWVSDVSHYDFVLLIDLLYDHALNMPYGKHCSACYDINQDIARFYNISEIEAFDKNREDIVKDFGCIDIKEELKHNALYDAKIIKMIYSKINEYGA